MWNVRVKRFYDSTQVQLFSRPVVKPEKKFSRFTGEIFIVRRAPRVKSFENPFTGRVEPLKEFGRDASDNSVYRSALHAKKMVYDIARSNCWDWFFTFTFNPAKTDRYDYDACVKRFSKWLNNARRTCPDMVYLVVPEQHKDGAYHFHGLFSAVDGLKMVDSGRNDASGNRIYNIGSYHWGFTTATRVKVTEAAAKYLCKYVTKDLIADTFGRKHYWASRNCARPVVEDLLVSDMDYLERIQLFADDAKHIKQVKTFFNKITYIEL